MKDDYVIVTPCRDEEDHIEATIRSVVSQSRPPKLWVIVDDGSTDATPLILKRAAAEFPFIKVVERTDRGGRAVGGGVVEAFYFGLDTLDLNDYEYLCKLDADLELPPTYFERILHLMASEPRLGNMSGKVYLRLPDGRLEYERMGDENAIGAAKFYRISCFEDIGGFVRRAGWDGIDGHMCRLKGWLARSADEKELRLIHRRLMGSSQTSIWHGRKRWGRLKWYMGSSPYYVLGVFLYRLPERPVVRGAVGILYGYLSAAVAREPRYEYPGFRSTLRRFERISSLRGKSAAINHFESLSKSR
jgi:glycosyltransferase involved in cell wall biosynthesis